jgi:hypothetical protein
MLFLGFLAFAAGPASAHPRVGVCVGLGGPVAQGYNAPPAPYCRRVYLARRYRYTHRRYDRYWDARFPCWRHR